MKRAPIIFGILILTIFFSGSYLCLAETVNLTPDKILRIQFNTNPPFYEKGYPPRPGTPDTFFLSLGYVNVPEQYSGYGALMGSFYDGQTLLGSIEDGTFGYIHGTIHPALTWKSSTSIYTMGITSIIDFTSILNGSIQGRIDFTIKKGMMTVDLTQLNILMIHSTVFNGGDPIVPDPIITSAYIVPEPATLLLLGLGGLFLRKRK